MKQSMGMRGSRYLALALITSTSQQALAQDAPAAASDSAAPAAAPAAESGSPGGDILVTARRRAETLVSVPVSITAFAKEDIARYSTDSIAALAVLTPGLRLNENTNSIGGSIFLRGIGTASASGNAAFDQSVSINVDGIQFSRANIMRVGQFDMQQIEVLRGPQALFFGKNSPAGVISITTADPTNKTEISGRAGYEFNARERFIEGIVSGPLTDGIKARLAAHYSKMDGYFINDAVGAAAAINAIRPGTVFGPRYDRSPHRDLFIGRVTLLIDPSDSFSIRAKGSYTLQRSDGPSRITQRFACPYGGPQTTGLANALGGQPGLAAALAIDDCSANGHFAQSDFAPAAFAFAPPGVNKVSGQTRSEIILGSLEMNYHPSEVLTLTSLTGYSKTDERNPEMYTWAPAYLASLGFFSPSHYRQFTQELRMSSDFNDFPVNFTLGGFYQDAKINVSNQNFPTNGPIFFYDIGTRAYSAFGQLLWDIVPELELAGGVRYSSERKTLAFFRNSVLQPTQVPQRTFNDWSPEATLTWRPNRDTTFYAAYKQGFKSGGFASSVLSGGPVAPPGPNLAYAPERARGGEIGAKAILLDNRLRVSLALYSYEYKDLQLSSADNSSGSIVVRITNAASARAKGVEFDSNWRPPFADSLTLRAAVNYSDARFQRYIAPCYTGQMISQGCNIGLVAGRFTQQDLSNKRLSNAPAWSGVVGFDHTSALGSTWKLGLSSDAAFESKFNPAPDLPDFTRQRGDVKLNASVRVFDDQHWEFAFIGRNLTNVYRALGSIPVLLTGSSALTGTNTPGGMQDIAGNVNRGRELWLQVKFTM